MFTLYWGKLNNRLPDIPYFRNMGKILITGANGLLGQHLVKELLAHTDAAIIAVGKGPCRLPEVKSVRLDYYDLDITDGIAAFAFYLTQKPDVIVHTAAKTQVDECELHPVDCWNVNVTATRFLVEAARKFNPYIIFLSTDFVFDGEAGPYGEDAIPAPLSYYGSSKVAGEKEILASGLTAAVVRTCLVYGHTSGGNRTNILTWVKQNLLQGKQIQLVQDQWRTPTYAGDLAVGIRLLIEQQATGIFHISGSEMMTPYDMAVRAAEMMGLDETLIEPVTAATFTQPAKRPPVTGFVLDKIKALGYQPTPFESGASLVLSQF